MKRKSHGKKGRIRRILLITGAALLLAVIAAVGVCCIIRRSAVQTVAAYREAYTEAVITVAEDGGVELFPEDGADCRTGVIFYCGAEIMPDAYIPLLAPVAEGGCACFIPKLTGNIALLEVSAAEGIIREHPEIERWYLAGHSLGGFAASDFIAAHPDMADGLILLAAYVDRDLSRVALPTLSVYGDADGVLNAERYENRRTMNTADFEEEILKGGNHAQFGDYGEQPGDHAAGITAEEQRKRTAELILDWISRH